MPEGLSECEAHGPAERLGGRQRVGGSQRGRGQWRHTEKVPRQGGQGEDPPWSTAPTLWPFGELQPRTWFLSPLSRAPHP